jgi:hypothetical protein
VTIAVETAAIAVFLIVGERTVDATRSFSLRRPKSERIQSVASEGRSRVGGAQEPECTWVYLRIPSIAGAPDPILNQAERSSFG